MTNRHTPNLGALLRCYEALQNWRALAMLAGSFVLGGLAISGGAAISAHDGSMAPLALLGLLGTLVIVFGLNAAGLILVDQAADAPLRSFTAAFLGGMQSAVYLIGLSILLGLATAVVLLVAYLFTLLARIPGVGGFFAFLFAGPLVVVLAATYAVLALAGPLMTVAVWHGEGFIGSFARAVGIVLKRPLEVLLHFLVLGILVFPAAAFLSGLVAAASFSVGGFYAAAALSGGGDGGGGYGGGDFGGGGMTGMLSHFGATAGGAGLSMGLVWFLVLAVTSLIYVLGTILVYRSTSEGLGDEFNEAISGRLGQFRRTLEENKPRRGNDRGGAAAEPSPLPQAAPTAPAQGAAAAAHCPSCHAEVGPDDAFCGGCGARLH